MTLVARLRPRDHDLGGGFTVRRMLPSAERQSVGPFLFFDHFGPVTVEPHHNHDVRPHPHIGLATVTYLFEGAIRHHDNLGFDQLIEPGAINWMTAGRGIVHSERRPPHLAERNYVNHGIQLWAALPREFEEVDPAFHHHPADSIPSLDRVGLRLRVLIGALTIDGQTLRSPVKTFSDTLYLDIAAQTGARLDLPAHAPTAEAPVQQRCVYAVDQAITVNGEPLEAATMAIVADNAAISIEAPSGARVLVLGGAPLDERRHIYWNFVSSSTDRIRQAADDWAAGRFGQVPGETERIELPARKP